MTTTTRTVSDTSEELTIEVEVAPAPTGTNLELAMVSPTGITRIGSFECGSDGLQVFVHLDLPPEDVLDLAVCAVYVPSVGPLPAPPRDGRTMRKRHDPVRRSHVLKMTAKVLPDRASGTLQIAIETDSVAIGDVLVLFLLAADGTVVGSKVLVVTGSSEEAGPAHARASWPLPPSAAGELECQVVHLGADGRSSNHWKFPAHVSRLTNG